MIAPRAIESSEGSISLDLENALANALLQPDILPREKNSMGCGRVRWRQHGLSDPRK
jgi:hypothetical protein